MCGPARGLRTGRSCRPPVGQRQGRHPLLAHRSCPIRPPLCSAFPAGMHACQLCACPVLRAVRSTHSSAHRSTPQVDYRPPGKLIVGIVHLGATTHHWWTKQMGESLRCAERRTVYSSLDASSGPVGYCSSSTLGLAKGWTSCGGGGEVLSILMLPTRHPCPTCSKDCSSFSFIFSLSRGTTREVSPLIPLIRGAGDLKNS